MNKKSVLFLKSNKNTELFFSKLFAMNYAVSQIDLIFKNYNVNLKIFACSEDLRKKIVLEYNTIGEAVLNLSGNKECKSVLYDFVNDSIWKNIKIIRNDEIHDYSIQFDRISELWQEIDLAKELIKTFTEYLKDQYSNIEEKLNEYMENRKQSLKLLEEISENTSKRIEEETIQRTKAIIEKLKRNKM